MTKLLEQAVAKARALSDAEQDAIAQIVIDEIESERRWDESLGQSPEKLRKLADKAWSEHEAGGSEELDFESGVTLRAFPPTSSGRFARHTVFSQNSHHPSQHDCVFGLHAPGVSCTVAR